MRFRPVFRRRRAQQAQAGVSAPPLITDPAVVAENIVVVPFHNFGSDEDEARLRLPGAVNTLASVLRGYADEGESYPVDGWYMWTTWFPSDSTGRSSQKVWHPILVGEETDSLDAAVERAIPALAEIITRDRERGLDPAPQTAFDALLQPPPRRSLRARFHLAR